MRKVRFMLGVILLLPVLAHANSAANVGAVICSGTESSSLGDVASFICSGDFSLSRGSITSDLKVILTSDGSLFLDNLSITAPTVELMTLGGALSLGNGVSISAGSFIAGAGGNTTPTINVSSGAVITVGTGANLHLYSGGEIVTAANNGDFSFPDNSSITIAPAVPEPENYALVLTGLGLLSFVSRQRKT